MVAILTNRPEFYADLSEEIRLFIDERKIPLTDTLPEEGYAVRHVFREDLSYSDTATLYLDGVQVSEYSFPYEKTEIQDPVARTRLFKHGAKVAVFRVLRDYFGSEKAWGSLTGVRPTKFFRDLCRRYDRKEALRQFREVYEVNEEKLSLVTGIVDVQEPFIRSVGKEDLDIYVGIPFCTSRCAYCSFLSSVTTRDGRLEEEYVKALLKEMELLRDLIKEKHIRSVYVGGGTPTAINETLLGMILERIASFSSGAELTVEAGRPDTITPEKLRLIKDAGAGRISVNPQTTCERTLEIIGRKHSISSFFEKYELARSFGFDAINTDLIAGLPGETEEDLMKSVRDCRNLGAENITVHTLAIKKGSRFGMQNAHHFVDEKTAERMVLHSRELLENSGYRPYYMYRQKYMAGNMENTGYALPGKECIYNIDIMEEEVSILAFGAGAASKRVDREGKKISRTVGLKDVRQYIDRIEEMAGNKLDLFSEGK